MFVDWLKILANEKQAVQFRSALVLVCEQKQCSHMPGGQDRGESGGQDRGESETGQDRGESDVGFDAIRRRF